MGVAIIPFYVMSYTLNELIGWLSIIQIVLTIKGIITLWSLTYNYENDKIKEHGISYKLLNISLDIIYIIMVGYTAFIIG